MEHVTPKFLIHNSSLIVSPDNYGYIRLAMRPEK